MSAVEAVDQLARDRRSHLARYEPSGIVSYGPVGINVDSIQ
jgi:hypothetical protein